MDRDEIFEKTREVIVDLLAVEEDDVTVDARLIDDLGADEIDLAEIVMSLEEQFGVAISDEDADRFKTVGDIVDFLYEVA